MAKVYFKLRGKSRSITYRLTNGVGGVDVTKTLPLKLSPSDIWDKKLQLAVNNLKLNQELLLFKDYLMTSINKAIVSQLNVDKILLNSLYQNYFHPVKNKVLEEPTLLEYLEIFKESVNSDSVRMKLGTLKLKLEAVPNIKIKDADITWMAKFSNDLLNKQYAESSINKNLQLIRQIVRYADLNDLKIKKNILSYSLLKTSSITHYLNEDELEQVFNFKTSNRSLENTRMLYLIGSTTGLRISDLMRVKTFKIKNNMLELTTQKTKQNIIIPIDPRVKGFINEIQPLAHPVFNRNIKKLFKQMDFKDIVKGYIRGVNNKRVLGMYPKYKLITSHTMRRSFATNLYGKVPTVVIMAITGHTTEKSFLTYIKKPQRDFAEQLKTYYERNY